MKGKGVLFVVSTPIGNLEDITLRALKVLREVDFILCEDTRVTRILLEHYEIKGPTLVRYDEHVENKVIPWVLEKIKEGYKFALVSNAGTPTIQDPGYRLVRTLREANVGVIPIPGVSASITALSVSGLPTDSFVFYGFLPRKVGKRKKLMESWVNEEKTIIFYESPERIKRTLEELREFEKLRGRFIFIAREMTKKFEEYIFAVLGELNLEEITPKGEFVVILEGARE